MAAADSGSHDLVDLVAARLGEVADLALLHVEEVPRGSAADELGVIVSDLIRRLARRRHAIKLVDRRAPEIPDLTEVWFGAGRAGLVDALRDHLDRRAAQGLVRSGELPSGQGIVARTIVETCVMWAVHLQWDPAPKAFRIDRSDDDLARVLWSLFARTLLQKNPLNRRSWTTREELRIAIVAWIERTYHRRRRQAALGRLTPIEYELIMTTTAAGAA